MFNQDRVGTCVLLCGQYCKPQNMIFMKNIQRMEGNVMSYWIFCGFTAHGKLSKLKGSPVAKVFWCQPVIIQSFMQSTRANECLSLLLSVMATFYDVVTFAG